MTRAHVAKQRLLTLTWLSLAVGATAGTITTLGSHVRREIRHRGYPSWEQCRCDFKVKEAIFQVWHSQHEQRGETIFAEEWGLQITKPPRWLRHLLHASSQIIATLNPRGNYVERVILSPQEARRLAYLLRGTSTADNETPEHTHIVWRREILYSPRHFFDKRMRLLYPTYIPQERVSTAQPLPALWDPNSNLPLPTEGELLDTPLGTRIDCIGWTPSQISYCTVRTNEDE